jgi:hypothetical protein
VLEQTNKGAAGDAGAKRPSRSKRWGTVNETTQEYPLGKTEVYETAREHPELLRKWGRKTIVDWDLLDEIMDALPAAELRPIPNIHDRPDTPAILAKRERSKAKGRAQRRKQRERSKRARREVA